VIEWKVLSSVLEGYERALGQRLNKDKTLVFFFSRNTSPGTWTELLNLMGISAFTQYDHYLGLLAIVGKSRIRELQTIVDRPI
jgi:hypothetical protein